MTILEGRQELAKSCDVYYYLPYSFPVVAPQSREDFKLPPRHAASLEVDYYLRGLAIINISRLTAESLRSEDDDTRTILRRRKRCQERPLKSISNYLS